MDSSSQIDTVQKFAEVIGDNDDLWSLLIEREVSRFDSNLGYEHIIAKGRIIDDVTFSNKGKVIEIKHLKSSHLLVIVDYGVGLMFHYDKKQFIRKFNHIEPSIIFDQGKKLSLLQNIKIERSIIFDQGKKLSLLQNIKDEFENNFLNADNFYQLHCNEYISFQEYKSEKSKYIQNWVKTNLNFSHDLEQAAAIGTVENHIQVIARAGSGKTSTLVNRAIFLQKHCGIAPGEMLLLAFNRKAAEEIRESLKLQLQNSVPHAMTFHALAYALVHPENILFDEPDGEQKQSRALQIVINDYLRDTIFYAKIRDLMMAAFHEDWERIISGGYDKTPEEMLRYRRSLPREGIDGKYYKSFGEKLIADFLFEHGIKYKYERNFWWNGINYRPDFTILTGEKEGIVIEYFGLEGDPDYDDMSHEKREYWANRPNWQLIALSPRPLKDQGAEVFCELLKDKLENLGIQCNPLSEETIWSRIKDRSIDRFTTVVKGFIQRCRKLSLTSEELGQIIYKHECVSKIEKQFLDLAYRFYKSYLRCLEDRGEEDFDGLMQKAVEVLASGQTIFRRKSGVGDLKSLRYIMIDEYQDFSELFYNLIEAIRKQNPVENYCNGNY
ncbi:UvrD-helicase domain-containing protein [Aphanizomenon sp. PH219]|nr:UvrD-helicase domain-containing protein [Aphanizomenon sp. 202]MDK2460460.1 UvrD-helicase domain-containing protein [Aphanizomenon sp. PH219]